MIKSNSIDFRRYLSLNVRGDKRAVIMHVAHEILDRAVENKVDIFL